MDMVKKEYAALFGSMKLPLMLGIVLIHCRYNTTDFPILRQSRFAVGDYVMSLFSDSLATVCVPLFFLISGFFFFYGVEKFSWRIYVGKLRRRVGTLLIPYLLWNLIGFGMLLLKKTAFFSGLAAPPDESVGLLKLFLLSFWSLSSVLPSGGAYPADFPLWFIRNLIIIVVFTPPVLYLMLKRVKWLAIVLLMIAEYFYNTHGLLYFSIGASVALLDIRKLSAFIGRYGWVFFVAYLVTTAVMAANDEYAILLAFPMIISGIIGLIWMAKQLNLADNKLIARWQSASFFIFAFHGLFCSFLRRAWLKLIIPQTSLSLVVCYVLSFCSMVMICLLVQKMVKMAFPRVLAVLTGNRSAGMPVSTIGR